MEKKVLIVSSEVHGTSEGVTQKLLDKGFIVVDTSEKAISAIDYWSPKYAMNINEVPPTLPISNYNHGLPLYRSKRKGSQQTKKKKSRKSRQHHGRK